MRIRLPWIISFGLLLLFAWWSHDRWREQATQIVQQMRTGKFVDEASRSQAFVIGMDEWLDCELPAGGSILRMLTNAGVREIPEQVVSLDTERPGWQYAVDYQIMDGEGEVLAQSTYHFRTQLTEYIDPETREKYTAAAFGDTALFPAGTRTMQYPLSGFARPPQRLRLRLAEKDPAIDEVGVRLYCRQERPGYDRASTWQRISHRRRQKLCRASVYPQELISLAERRNLLRWQWLPIPPSGLEGVDYQRRVLYTLDDVSGQEAGVQVLPVGHAVRDGLFGVIPLPDEEGTARLELQRIHALDVEPEPTRVDVQWYGRTIHQRRRISIDLTETVTQFDFPAEGGLLVFRSDVELVIQAGWRPTSAPADQEFQDITPKPAYLQTYRTESYQPVDYTVAHIDSWPTPFYVALRRQIPGSSTGTDQQPHALQPARVEWQFLGDDQQVVAQGQLLAGDVVSSYDYDMKNNSRVTEPSAYYFAVPPEVRHIRFRSRGLPVLISAFTRPPDLAKVTYVPEDYSAYYRPGSTSRNWFMLRPDDHLRLLEEARTVSLQVRPRPAEDDPELVAGRYLWEDFRPSGFWRARYLLVPRNADAPLRDEALTATFVELQPGRNYAVRFRADPNRSTIEPRLIYVDEKSSAQSLDVMLDGALYHTVRLRAARGEVALPALAAGDGAAPRTLQVRADGPVRVFVNSLELSEQPTYLKRVALGTDGRLRFQYDKTLPGKEVLALWFYGNAGQKKRAKLRVQISSPATADLAPTAGWTIRQREFDLKPVDDAQQSIVLGTTDEFRGAGRVCYIPLGEDLPAGRYPIEIELVEGQQGYVVLSKTTAGVALERKFLLDRELVEPAAVTVTIQDES